MIRDMSPKHLSTLIAVAAIAVMAGLPNVAAQERPLGPPPGVGQNLEGTETEEMEERQEGPLIPVNPGDVSSEDMISDLLSGTRMILGDLDILPIPLQQIPNYREYTREIVEELARYAHGRDREFTVLTRPGFDLLTWSQR